MEDSLSAISMANLSNDTRGWIMTIVSGFACVLGASIIYADYPMRLIPKYRNFRIQDSTTFLSASMALSFGVMEYSSLFSLLPESLSYFKKAGFTRRGAGFISIGSFIGGAMAIMVISKILHRFMPSHAVGCDHSHDINEEDAHDHDHEHRPSRSRSGSSTNRHKPHAHFHAHASESDVDPTEESPLLDPENGHFRFSRKSTAVKGSSSWHNRKSIAPPTGNRLLSTSQERKLSMIEVPKRIKEFVLDRKSNCDEGGPCFGYSDPCGQGCLKVVRPSFGGRRSSTIIRSGSSCTALIPEVEEEAISDIDVANSTAPMLSSRSHTHSSNEPHKTTFDSDNETEDLEAQDGAHHHHIPTNTFLDLSFQTSIAIALHKIPEGFITYATNHVNPTLGVSVFIALLFHNLTEGFALALPLYLATNSRLRALVYATVLGGLSQPLGALIATIWFAIAKNEGGHGSLSPSSTLYGCMFAVTGGIMMSVGISLFCEAMAFHHNRNLCICFAFIGMGILGVTGSLAGDWKN